MIIEYLSKIYADRAGPLVDIDERRLLNFLRTKSEFKRIEENSRVILLSYLFNLD